VAWEKALVDHGACAAAAARGAAGVEQARQDEVEVEAIQRDDEAARGEGGEEGELG